MEQYTYLAHHGVKGMRWGVRKQAENLGAALGVYARGVTSGYLKDKASYAAAKKIRAIKYSPMSRSVSSCLSTAQYKAGMAFIDGLYELQEHTWGKDR